MYDAESLRLFAAVKAVCDPDNLLNPGNLVDPDPFDAVAATGAPARGACVPRSASSTTAARSATRCTAAPASASAWRPPRTRVMCPSYLATRDEKDSTRGRARVLQEALDGSLVEGLGDPAVAEALDLCLACKGCASDCPTGVDMATYKAEALYQRYDGPDARERRPRSHRLLGRLPRWAALAAPVAGLANGLMGSGPVARVARATAASTSGARCRPSRARPPRCAGPRAWHAATAPGRLDLGGLVHRPLPPGQRPRRDPAAGGGRPPGAGDRRRRLLRAHLDHDRPARPGPGRSWSARCATLAPYVAAACRSSGSSRPAWPRCAATRSSSPTTRSETRRRAQPGRAARRLDLSLPDLTGVEMVAQPHCHQAAVIGWDADQALLERAGATVTRVAGCCGLAGNFGMEKGHYDVSVAVAETHLLPGRPRQSGRGRPRRRDVVPGPARRPRGREGAALGRAARLPHRLARVTRSGDIPPGRGR